MEKRKGKSFFIKLIFGGVEGGLEFKTRVSKLMECGFTQIAFKAFHQKYCVCSMVININCCRILSKRGAIEKKLKKRTEKFPMNFYSAA